MSEPLREPPYLTAAQYLEMEEMSPFKHEFANGVMYAMHCEGESDYFEMETESPFRHEYVNGVMYAMAGISHAHNDVAVNLVGMLGNRLRDQRCSGTMSSMKLKHRHDGGTDYYYPDAMIYCEPNEVGETGEHAWIEAPAVIFEIISARTRRVDEGRKRDANLTLASLDAYVRIEEEKVEAVVERRSGDKWLVERVRGLAETVRLHTVGVELPLEELYECVKFRS